ncbi:MAG: hypothetical protein EKK31_06655 [Hyphomicrobiales bacterium]|nr:MAG: hypothetical protein EKK31_06655 [Hyphomicrobiales bacterium]
MDAGTATSPLDPWPCKILSIAESDGAEPLLAKLTDVKAATMTRLYPMIFFIFGPFFDKPAFRRQQLEATGSNSQAFSAKITSL